MPKTSDRNSVSLLTLFFAIAYFGQAFGQAQLISLPLTFLSKSAGHSASETALMFSAFTLPWLLKPLYGMVSDFVPFLGYRRKSYIAVFSLINAVAFCAVPLHHSTAWLTRTMAISALAMAVSDAAMDGLMVERARKSPEGMRWQSMEWAVFRLSSIVCQGVAGWLIEQAGVKDALAYACLSSAVLSIGVSIAAVTLIKEKKIQVARSAARFRWQDIFSSMKSKKLWIGILVIAVWRSLPDFSFPLSYWKTDHLGLSAEAMGMLGSIGAAAAIGGALFYNRKLSGQFAIKPLLYVGGILTTVSIASELALLHRNGLLSHLAPWVVAAASNFNLEIASQILLSFAAIVCPGKAEAMSFGLLMAAYNLSAPGGVSLGVWIYRIPMMHNLAPSLIATTILAALLVGCIRFIPNNLDETDTTEKPA